MKRHQFFSKSTKIYLFGIIILCMMIVLTESFLIDYNKNFYYNVDSNKSAEFREMKLSEDTLVSILEFSKNNNIPISKVITTLMIYQNFHLERLELKILTMNEFEKIFNKIQNENEDAYFQLLESYQKIWDDLLYFPVAGSKINEKAVVSYEDSWMYERTFGGNRGHEGTDIMAGINIRGYYPVVSITKGLVEQIGWLTQGGYRIGVRSDHGGYFYYAHLSEYAEEFQIGDQIEAGQLLGFMGDTGYSQVEGTSGMFDVHLHIGIYIDSRDNSLVSINPFWILKYLENSKLYYSY